MMQAGQAGRRRGLQLPQPLLDDLQEQRKTDPKFAFSGDGIHPNPTSHLLMAQTILTSLSLPMHSDDLKGELATIMADPLYALMASHNTVRADGWTSYVGYKQGIP